MVECGNCKMRVTPVKGYNLALMVVFTLMGIIPGLVYWFYSMSGPADKCPVCGKKAAQPV